MKNQTAPSADKPAPPRLYETTPRPDFKDEAHERRWTRKMQARQTELDQAWAKYPPGTVLHVSAARGLATHRRAGVDFSGKATTAVEVVADNEADLARRVSQGQAVVSPLGAAAIADDDALIVFAGPQMTRAERAAADEKAAQDRAELERLRAENARLRAGKAAPSDGRPERLARDKSTPATPPSSSGDKAGEFGEGDKA